MTTETNLDSSFMERILVASTVQKAKDETAESTPGADLKGMEHKLELLARVAVQPAIAAMKSEIERVLADFGFVTEAKKNVLLRAV